MNAVLRRAALAWCIIAVAETVHGVFRGLFLTPAIGDLPARQVGVFVGAAIIMALAWLLVAWIGAVTTRALLAVGGVWVVLMLTFEIALGRALGFSWERLLADYDLRQGGLMLFGMAVLFLSPLLASRLRRIPHMRLGGRRGGMIPR